VSLGNKRYVSEVALFVGWFVCDPCRGAVKEGVKHGYGDDGGCGGFRGGGVCGGGR